MGVETNTIEGTISVPAEKLSKIRNLCENWSSKSNCTKKQLQSLLGSLLHITKCVRSARFFLNRMLSTLRSAKYSDTIQLNPEFQKDLNWFRTFLSTFNGTTFYKHKPVGNLLEVDDSKKGLGGPWANLVYKIGIPLGYRAYGIVKLEMLNVMVPAKLWSRFWKGHKITLECDNEAVVTILRHGKTRDPILVAIAHNNQNDSKWGCRDTCDSHSGCGISGGRLAVSLVKYK